MKRLLFFIFIAIFFISCSKKEYFEPQDSKTLKYGSFTDSYLKFSTLDGATFEDGSVVTKLGFYKKLIHKKNRLFINETKEFLIFSDKKNIILLNKKTNNQLSFALTNRALSANIKDNLLAVVQAENILLLFDIKTKKLLFKSKQKQILSTTTHIAKPLFLDDLLIYPTLSGKIIIVDINKKQEVRTILVSNEQYFNNIMFLKSHKDKLYVASRHKLLMIGQKRVEEFEDEINAISFDGKNFFVALVDGRIVKLDEYLNKIDEKKFKFAGLIAMTLKNNSLYVLERAGYLIKLDLELKESKIFALNDNVENFVFASNSKIYYERRVVNLP